MALWSVNVRLHVVQVSHALHRLWSLCARSRRGARNAAADVFASIKNIIGGEVEEYSRLLQQTRDQAVERMITDAKDKGANAIICFRIQSSTIAQGASEVVAYGTGVILED